MCSLCFSAFDGKPGTYNDFHWFHKAFLASTGTHIIIASILKHFIVSIPDYSLVSKIASCPNQNPTSVQILRDHQVQLRLHSRDIDRLYPIHRHDFVFLKLCFLRFYAKKFNIYSQKLLSLVSYLSLSLTLSSKCTLGAG